MKIKGVYIDRRAKLKVYHKHGVRFSEIKEVFLRKPLVRRTRDRKYMAVNHVNRYITVVFSCKQEIADILTAYPSSDWQVRMFKKKR